jgi:hypothetical protein
MEPQSQKGLQKYKTIAKIGQKKIQNDGKGKLAFFIVVYLVPVKGDQTLYICTTCTLI